MAIEAAQVAMPPSKATTYLRNNHPRRRCVDSVAAAAAAAAATSSGQMTLSHSTPFVMVIGDITFSVGQRENSCLLCCVRIRELL